MTYFDKVKTDEQKARLKKDLESLSDGNNKVEVVWDGNHMKLTMTGTLLGDKAIVPDEKTPGELAGAKPTPGAAQGIIPRYKGDTSNLPPYDPDETISKIEGAVKVSEKCWDVTDEHDTFTMLAGSGCKKSGTDMER